jgi:thiol-disulfide isomerase/thioredoxin
MPYDPDMPLRRLVLAAFVLAACEPKPAADAPRPPRPDVRVVRLSLPTDGGELVTVPVNGVQTTVLDFFGPTCDPCKKKVPELVAKRQAIEHKGGRLVLVAVLAEGESTAQAKAALESWGVSHPFLVDSGDASRREVGFDGLPATAILDSAGRLKWLAPAGATADDVLAALPSR